MKYVIVVLLAISVLLTPKDSVSNTDTTPYFILTAAHRFDVDPDLMLAICRVESKCRQSAFNYDDGNRKDKLGHKIVSSHGLFQMQLGTARHLGFKGSRKDLMRPDVNTYYAAKLLRHLDNRYGDMIKVISAYNAGHYTKHNKMYVHKVMKWYINYKMSRQ